MSGRLLALSALAVVACHTPSPPTTARPTAKDAADAGVTTTAATEPPPPTLRLPAGFAPTRYDLDLAVDPGKPTFDGTIVLTGTLAAPTSVLWLDAEGLTFGKVTVNDQSATATAQPHDFVALRTTAPIPAGTVKVTIAYSGPLSTSDSYGAFVEPVDGVPYAFTDSEPMGARRIFPSVDEPWNKAVWHVRLRVPKDDVAVCNAPVANDATDGDTRTVEFEDTRPLPTYLIAFGVGPFEFADGGKTKGGAPIRIVAFKGRAADAAYPAKVTGKIVGILEDWFGTPYPFQKLDLLPIPSTVGFGAMENAGLITFRSTFLLMPKKPTDDQKRGFVWGASHEISHQWFGDLVTPAWWDDLWLNESFATWMEDKALTTFSPAWGLRVPLVASRSNALDDDGLVTARRVHQPIGSADDIESAFDGITYEKGAAVIRMFEAWIGADKFQAGVRKYLADHAGGTATTADFLAAIDEASPLDVTPAFSTFLDQAGAPLVDADVQCTKDKRQSHVHLSQMRWLPQGSKAPAGDAPSWQIPVCVAYGTAKVRKESCTLLATPEADLALDGGCPTWLLANADGKGYYRSAYDPRWFDALIKNGWSQIGPHERVLVAGDLRASVRRGDAHLDDELDLVPALLANGQRSRPAIELAIQIAEDAFAVSVPDDRPLLAAWVEEQFGARARKIGLLPDKGDDSDRERSRAALVDVASRLGDDPQLAEKAVGLSKKWSTLPASVRSSVLEVAARANADVRKTLRDAVKTASDAEVERDLWHALAAGTDADDASAALALLLDPAIDLKEGRELLTEMSRDPRTQPIAEAFLRAHWDELLPRLPGEGAADLVEVVTASCDAKKRADAETWAHAHVDALAGGTRATAEALERMDQCIADRAALSEDLDRFLAGRKLAELQLKAHHH